MNDPVQIIRKATAAMAEKIKKNPRTADILPFSMVQHVEDCQALLKRIDELEKLRALRD